MKIGKGILLLLLFVGSAFSGCSNDRNSTFDQTETENSNREITQIGIIGQPAETVTPIVSNEWFEEFVHYNGGCKVPCVLGLTTGKMFSALNFDDIQKLSEFGTAYLHDDSGSIVFQYELGNDQLIKMYLAYRLSNSQIIESIIMSGTLLQAENTSTSYKEVFADGAIYNILHSYSPKTVMDLYGVPTKIYLFVDLMQIDQPIEYRPVVFWFDYSSRGFVIEYTTSGIESDSGFQSCLQESNFRLYVYPKGETILDYINVFEEISARADFSPYLPIEDVSEISTDRFVEDFLADNTFCLEVAKSYWPLP